ncbi:MAG: UbiA family prenyltransferase [Herbinix sp.]|nr:UbiA family prenyltransferase [Herbinix sp.]
MRRFFSYVEITTKITSTFAFLLTVAFLLYQKYIINWKLTLIFFTSMLLFDFTTTAINNYIDTKDNNQTLHFQRRTALILIYLLFGISASLGIYLAFLTDVVVLLSGGICFLFGVFYTYGPVPISRQPLGEFLSGFFYGFLIPFILLYINMPKGTLLTLDLSYEIITFQLKVIPLLSLLLISVIPFCTTANIMLANNICDLEKDIAVKRHTLPYYIGEKSLFLFAGLYYIAYFAIIMMVVFQILSPLCLLSLLTIIFVQKNIKSFFKKQDKETTFILAVRNYVIIMGIITLLIFLSALHV